MFGTEIEYILCIMIRKYCELWACIAIIIIAVSVLGISCSYADSADGDPSRLEALILERINSVRLDPWAEADRLGYDIDLLRKEIGPVIAEIWDQGLKPLVWNSRLSKAAQNHIQDMLQHLYYSHVSLDGTMPFDRIKKEGINPLFWAESMGAVAFENVISPEEAVNLILDGLFSDAFAGGEEGSPLLDHVLTDIGFNFFGGRLSFDKVDLNVFVFTADLIMPDPRMELEGLNSGFQNLLTENNNAIIWGRVYKDLNSNGVYDPGEGLSRQTIVLRGPLGIYGPVDPSWAIATGSCGCFFQILPVGNYDMIINDANTYYQQSLSLKQGISSYSLNINVAE